MTKKIVLIIGARPNFMKAFPVYEALKNDFELTLIHTGQHFDAKMSDVFFNQLKWLARHKSQLLYFQYQDSCFQLVHQWRIIIMIMII